MADNDARISLVVRPMMMLPIAIMAQPKTTLLIAVVVRWIMAPHNAEAV